MVTGMGFGVFDFCVVDGSALDLCQKQNMKLSISFQSPMCTMKKIYSNRYLIF